MSVSMSVRPGRPVLKSVIYLFLGFENFQIKTGLRFKNGGNFGIICLISVKSVGVDYLA